MAFLKFHPYFVNMVFHISPATWIIKFSPYIGTLERTVGGEAASVFSQFLQKIHADFSVG